jgi:hypothetical protein
MPRRSTIGATPIFALCALALLAPTSAIANTAEPVSGQWYSAVPCLPTNYDPVSTEGYCTASSTWTGTWTGQTIYHAQGTADLLTGDEQGTIEERLFGQTADGHRGELHFIETYAVNGATNHITISARILDGSGDFAGATGAIRFTGTVSPIGNGLGTYIGSWTHPAYGSPSGSKTNASQAGSTQPSAPRGRTARHHRARTHHRSAKHRHHRHRPRQR